MQHILLDETVCKYVSSRGLLKSCVCKSAELKSTVIRVYNYDFSNLVDGDTIYICSAAIYDFVENHLPKIKTKFILLSGDSDTSIPVGMQHSDYTFNKLINNEYLIVWFSQNLVYSPKQYPKLEYLPIGLDYHTMSEQEMWWGPKSSPTTQEDLLISLKKTAHPLDCRKPIAYTTCNFTLHRGCRADAYHQTPPELVYYEKDAVQREVTWRTQTEYAFVLSPTGEGMDCHRTWEALCLGCIPIMISTPLDDMFEGLPVLIVKSWSDITKELLDETIKDYKQREFCMEKLELKYWLNRIESYK